MLGATPTEDLEDVPFLRVASVTVTGYNFSGAALAGCHMRSFTPTVAYL